MVRAAEARPAAPADVGATVPVSVGMTTGQGWPHVARFVRHLEVAAARAGGELVVVDGSGRQPPPPTTLSPLTRWLSFPRSSVYELRPTLLEACRGAIVALTEDHCRVDPEWAAILVRLHGEHPDALAIGGPVGNDATAGAFDRASYFVVQARCIPPVRPGPARRLAHANVSYKRQALGAGKAIEGLGILDSFHQTALASQAGAILIDPRPMVWHDQSLGIRGFIRQHFDAGRTWGGFVRAEGGPRRLVRLVAAPLVPWLRLSRAVIVARRSAYRGDVASSIVPMIVLLFCQAAGQVIGLIAGPGDSPLRVEG